MTRELADKLNLIPNGNQTLSISTFGSTKPKEADSPYVDVEIFLKDGSTQKITANILPVLTNSISRQKLLPADLQVLKKYKLEQFADHLPANTDVFSPDILVGIDYFWSFISAEKQTTLPSGLKLIPSSLGMLIGGATTHFSSSVKGLKPVQSFIASLTSAASIGAKLPDLQQDFWSLETIGITDPTVDDPNDVAIEKFQKGIVLEDGRYNVLWPWKSDQVSLPSNYPLALGRLRSLSGRLCSDPMLLKKYSEIIQSQEEKGIIERVTSASETSSRQHYLPHHPVVMPQKATTKVRIVYDGSSKINPEANSLNDCLLSGPNMIANLCGILMRFRLPEIAVLADIEKAFLNVGLHMPDCDVCRFLQFDDSTNPKVDGNLATYRFKRIPIGINSSPFLLDSPELSFEARRQSTEQGDPPQHLC